MARWLGGSLARWDKGLIDVPSIIFFIISYRLKALKTLYFYSCKIIENEENKLKRFLQRILQEMGSPRNYEKKNNT